jgi:hypothetical protein
MIALRGSVFAIKSTRSFLKRIRARLHTSGSAQRMKEPGDVVDVAAIEPAALLANKGGVKH